MCVSFFLLFLFSHLSLFIVSLLIFLQNFQTEQSLPFQDICFPSLSMVMKAVRWQIHRLWATWQLFFNFKFHIRVGATYAWIINKTRNQTCTDIYRWFWVGRSHVDLSGFDHFCGSSVSMNWWWVGSFTSLTATYLTCVSSSSTLFINISMICVFISIYSSPISPSPFSYILVLSASSFLNFFRRHHSLILCIWYGNPPTWRCWEGWKKWSWGFEETISSRREDYCFQWIRVWDWW